MKLTLSRDALLAALRAANKAVERRNTIPILSNLLLKADGRTLSVTATDLDLQVEMEVEAGIAAPGAITAPAGLLADFAAKLAPGAELAMTLEGDALHLKSGRWSARLQTLPAADYPLMTSPDGADQARWAALPGMIAAVSFAVSTEETRYYLNGVFIHRRADGTAAVVATDGHRLARMTGEMPEALADMPGVILPRKACALAVSLFAGREDAAIAVSGTKMTVSGDGLRLTSKLIDGTFPDYDRVIPSGNANRFSLDAASFAAAADRVSAISSERGRAVKIAFGQGVAVLDVNNPDSGAAHDELACDLLQGAPVEIGFNARYVADALAALGDGSFEIALGDAGSPALLQRTGSSLLLVLMPMRV